MEELEMKDMELMDDGMAAEEATADELCEAEPLPECELTSYESECECDGVDLKSIALGVAAIGVGIYAGVKLLPKAVKAGRDFAVDVKEGVKVVHELRKARKEAKKAAKADKTKPVESVAEEVNDYEEPEMNEDEEN